MPLELQIIRASEFIRLGAHGHFDLAASKTALSVIARACRKRGIHQAMVDLRALQPGPKPVFSRDDLIELVQTFCRLGFTREDSLAVLYQSDPHHRARQFAFLGMLHGWTVRAFDDFEKALSWLSSGAQTAERPVRSAAEKPIRVRTPEREAQPTALAVSLQRHPEKTAAARKRAVAKKHRPGCLPNVPASAGLRK